MKNKYLKKVQRIVNQTVRTVNKNIYDDDLWKGRFAIRQVNRIDRYVDKSCYVSQYYFKLFDKASGHTNLCCFAVWSWKSEMVRSKIVNELYIAMNEFIVEDCQVWKENPRPNIKTSKNYREVKI